MMVGGVRIRDGVLAWNEKVYKDWVFGGRWIEEMNLGKDESRMGDIDNGEGIRGGKYGK